MTRKRRRNPNKCRRNVTRVDSIPLRSSAFVGAEVLSKGTYYLINGLIYTVSKLSSLHALSKGCIYTTEKESFGKAFDLHHLSHFGSTELALIPIAINLRTTGLSFVLL
jgi:hypothetical protein